MNTLSFTHTAGKSQTLYSVTELQKRSKYNKT